MSLPPFSELDLEACQLGESAGDFALATREDSRTAASLLAAQARRQVELFSADLEPFIYDQAAFIEALTQLSISSSRARVRILVKDFERSVKEGHRLVELSRRLSSFVELRKVHSDYQNFNETFLLVDDYGLLLRRHAPRFEGVFSCRAPLEVRRLRAYFDEVWGRSEPDPDVRRLHL